MDKLVRLQRKINWWIETRELMLCFIHKFPCLGLSQFLYYF